MKCLGNYILTEKATEAMSNISIKEYAKEVQLMDSLQQEYFKTRDRGVLTQSKVQERKVRMLTKEILDDSPKQLNMF